MKNNPEEIYRRLYSIYGPQGWWPLIFSNTEEKGYHRTIPALEKTSTDKFEIITGAVLTQNVNWGNVYKCLINLKINNIITPQRFLEENPELIKSLIKSSCYYNQKYKKLYSLISCLLDGNYFDINIPDRRSFYRSTE